MPSNSRRARSTDGAQLHGLREAESEDVPSIDPAEMYAMQSPSYDQEPPTPVSRIAAELLQAADEGGASLAGLPEGGASLAGLPELDEREGPFLATGAALDAGATAGAVAAGGQGAEIREKSSQEEPPPFMAFVENALNTFMGVAGQGETRQIPRDPVRSQTDREEKAQDQEPQEPATGDLGDAQEDIEVWIENQSPASAEQAAAEASPAISFAELALERFRAGSSPQTSQNPDTARLRPVARTGSQKNSRAVRDKNDPQARLRRAAKKALVQVRSSRGLTPAQDGEARQRQVTQFSLDLTQSPNPTRSSPSSQSRRERQVTQLSLDLTQSSSPTRSLPSSTSRREPTQSQSSRRRSPTKR